jgi:hypothetical protein
MKLTVGIALLLGLTVGVAIDKLAAQHISDINATFLSVNFEAKGDKR